ncbi:tryptophanase [Candidatus Roizmanbacteria bacterium]|nr:tryptophanase [Candidatus Roizmanbacteria bacterium]
MHFSDVLTHFSPQDYLSSSVRPYFNHSVQFKRHSTSRERVAILENAGLNVFQFPSEFVSGCDLLSDSGTTTMTNEQWAALSLGDEAYGSNKGYFMLRDRVYKTFGESFDCIYLFHQGRAAEHALFSQLARIGKHLIIPSNGHFDTTLANIEMNGMKAVTLFSKKLHVQKSSDRFKGNIDIDRLEALLKKHHQSIPLMFLTITNNTGGGQPVSMENIRLTAERAKSYAIPLFFDACRFAENAWFIKQYEPEFRNMKISAIVKEMFSYVDGFTISFKKDGLVNMGGGLIIKSSGQFIKKFPDLVDDLTNYQIMTEGHPTYGGMSGRDIMTLVYGLKTVLREQYLSYRVGQIESFGQKMLAHGLPVLTPFGGHAIYLDMNRFFEDTSLQPNDFGGISFTALLLALFGHRACELGNFAFGVYDLKTKKESFPEVNFVRFAVPRLRYEKEDLEHVAESVKHLYELRDKIPGVEVVYGKELPLRHFKARFKFKSRSSSQSAFM